MKQEFLKNPIKHKSGKQIIKLLYSDYGQDIHSLINIHGNWFQIILNPDANFKALEEFITKFADDQLKKSREEAFTEGDGFSMLLVHQVGNENRSIVSINSSFLYPEVSYNGKLEHFYLVKLRGTDEIDVHTDSMFYEVLTKKEGQWHMFIFDDLAKTLGILVDKAERSDWINFKSIFS